MTRSGILLLVVLVHSIILHEAAAQARRGGTKPQKRAVPAYTKGKTVAPKPVILPSHEMQFSRVGASEVWIAKHRDSILARPQLFWLEPGSLLFRRLPTDTMFLRIALEPPPFPYNENYFIEGHMCLVHQDLNHDGIPEALVGFWRGWDHGNRVAINLIDVSGTPRLLLKAVTEITESGWGPDPDNPEREIFTTDGWERSVKLGGDDIRIWLEGGASDGIVVAAQPTSAVPYLRIGSLVHHSFTDPYKRGITPLTPGRYQYQIGHLVWVGK